MAAAAAALVFLPISLFADDLQNCDSSLRAPPCSSGTRRAAAELPALAAAAQKHSQEGSSPADVSGASVLAEGRLIVGQCCFSDKPSCNCSPGSRSLSEHGRRSSYKLCFFFFFLPQIMVEGPFADGGWLEVPADGFNLPSSCQHSSLIRFFWPQFGSD